MGFFKSQQINLALKLLAWQHQKQGIPLPGRAVLEQQARQLVEDAHRIARERGGNVLAILKEMSGDIRRR